MDIKEVIKSTLDKMSEEVVLTEEQKLELAQEAEYKFTCEVIDGIIDENGEIIEEDIKKLMGKITDMTMLNKLVEQAMHIVDNKDEYKLAGATGVALVTAAVKFLHEYRKAEAKTKGK